MFTEETPAHARNTIVRLFPTLSASVLYFRHVDNHDVNLKAFLARTLGAGKISPYSPGNEGESGEAVRGVLHNIDNSCR